MFVTLLCQVFFSHAWPQRSFQCNEVPVLAQDALPQICWWCCCLVADCGCWRGLSPKPVVTGDELIDLWVVAVLDEDEEEVEEQHAQEMQVMVRARFSVSTQRRMQARAMAGFSVSRFRAPFSMAIQRRMHALTTRPARPPAPVRVEPMTHRMVARRCQEWNKQKGWRPTRWVMRQCQSWSKEKGKWRNQRGRSKVRNGQGPPAPPRVPPPPPPPPRIRPDVPTPPPAVRPWV